MTFFDFVKSFKQKRYETLDHDDQDHQSRAANNKRPSVVGGLVGGPVGVGVIWPTKKTTKLL